MIGKELIHDPSLSRLEKAYVRVFGIPINGLRIRARRILPLIHGGCRTILDSGCGQGVFTFEIARRFPDSTVTGIDINDDLLERNRLIADREGLTNCRFEREDLTEMSGAERFDLILSVDVLEHIRDDIGTLKNYYGALLPGGDLLLHVPSASRRWLFFGWRENFDVDGHVRPGYTMEEIAKKVEAAGLEIIESRHTYGWLETVTNNISYIITGARMKRKHLYALVFPVLSIVSYFGRNSRPERGAGILIKARKPEQ